ncbi:MAG: GlsB/YeaQ/YmgE family stress response membrane protein [Segniliparus sp.]|uniref:GlsB/YeaQ/YmgE family stress response membrane protein n=1 Tax=Segniliparus sp. TaxID=2804064 RepID=UPI003F2C079D
MASTQVLAEATKYTSFGWIGYIIIGGLAGWLASKFLGTDAQQGILLNVLFGVVGGLIGGFLLKFVWHSSGGFWFTFISALIGASILIWLWKLISKK